MTTKWGNVGTILAWQYNCGHCASLVSSDKGWAAVNNRQVYICPGCDTPTFVQPDLVIKGSNRQYPPPPLPGLRVNDLPDDVKRIWNEIRRCLYHSSPTSAVLLSRKLLMHVAVNLGATAGENFCTYVDHLVNGHYSPPNSHPWVDKIRVLGNTSNHEIVMNTNEDAEMLVKFLELLLKNIYESQAMVAAITP
jgi:hypothetical protein